VPRQDPGNLICAGGDPVTDGYSDDYVVYRMPVLPSEFFEAHADWSHLAIQGVRIGTVRVADVQFDITRRRMIHATALTASIQSADAGGAPSEQ
jgi:hypothetical protein